MCTWFLWSYIGKIEHWSGMRFSSQSKLINHKKTRIIDEQLNFCCKMIDSRNCKTSKKWYSFRISPFSLELCHLMHEFHTNKRFYSHHHHFPNICFSYDLFNWIVFCSYSLKSQTQSRILQTFLIKQLCWPRRLPM